MTEEHNRVLVIAYGNPLRCDDGIAWQVAERIKQDLPSSARVICVHQLTPELAEDASRAGTVIFLDAARNEQSSAVITQAVTALPSQIRFSHHLAPADLLALCRDLYATLPIGFLISLKAQTFAHGEKLSPAAINAIPEAVSHVAGLVRQVAAGIDCEADAMFT